MTEVAIPALDGSQLLGFLAGLGALEILASTRGDAEAPALAWRHAGVWQPVLAGCSGLEELADRVIRDATSDLVANVLGFRYLKVEKQGPKVVSSLTPPVPILRAWMKSQLAHGNTREVELAAGLMCETATTPLKDGMQGAKDDLLASGIPFEADGDLGQRALPSPFDFTSRNTQFLDQIRRIGASLSPQGILDELREGLGSSIDRTMRWDTMNDLPAALFGNVRARPRPAAEWLAFRGLSFFTLCGKGDRLDMAGLTGRRKAGTFAWPIWEAFLSRDMVKTTLHCRMLLRSAQEREARGVRAAFSVDLVKDATGYDGSVTPSAPIAATP